MTWRWSDAGNNLPRHLVLIPIVSEATATVRRVLLFVYRAISNSRFLFSRAAGACYRVCDVRWSFFVFSSLVVAEWFSSGGAFHPSAGVATTSVHTTVIWTVCTVCTVYSVHRVVTSLLSCRPPRRLPPSPAPHLTVSPCGAAVGWAGLSTQNIQTIPNIVTQSGSASPTHRYVNVLCHCQLWLNPSRVWVIATGCHEAVTAPHPRLVSTEWDKIKTQVKTNLLTSSPHTDRVMAAVSWGHHKDPHHDASLCHQFALDDLVNWP